MGCMFSSTRNLTVRNEINSIESMTSPNLIIKKNTSEALVDMGVNGRFPQIPKK